MTNEEAIKFLKEPRMWEWLNVAQQIALDMAIDALSQEPCEDDAISRAEAVKVASGYCHPSNIAKELAKLPSVQPKYNANEWCHDCKEYNRDKHCCPRYNNVIRNAVEKIKQPKTGHWIKENILTCKCSICGKEAIVANWQCILSDYCPHCGAKMIEPQAESEGTDAGSN